MSLHDLADKREREYTSLFQAFEEMVGEKKRLTLEDLQLTREEQAVLKSCDKQFRHTLWKAGEHLCLTSYPECCRKSAVRYREYLRALTLSELNKIPELDDSPLVRAEERSKKFFEPKKND